MALNEQLLCFAVDISQTLFFLVYLDINILFRNTLLLLLLSDLLYTGELLMSLCTRLNDFIDWKSSNVIYTNSIYVI